MNRVDCPLCSFPLKYDEANAGRKARCPRCAYPIRLPGGAKQAAAAEPGKASPTPLPPNAASRRPAAVRPAAVRPARPGAPAVHQRASGLFGIVFGVFDVVVRAVRAPFRRH
jgi:hypothetical protein